MPDLRCVGLAANAARLKAGPIPGAYVTTSQAVIDALPGRYEDAMDHPLAYAERAGKQG